MKNLVKRSIVALLVVASLWFVFNIYIAGQTFWALGTLVLLSAAFIVYCTDVAFAYRYLFPGLAGMLVFVALPLVYTAQIGFTNYSSNNLLSLERARAYLLDQGEFDDTHTFTYTLHRDGTSYRIVLAPANEDRDARMVSGPLKLDGAHPAQPLPLGSLEGSGFAPEDPLAIGEVIARRDALMSLRLSLPASSGLDGVVLSYAGLREFGAVKPTWHAVDAKADGALTLVATGDIYAPNAESGFFENSAGERVQPGFKVGIGFGNYVRMLGDPDFRGPFFSIFVWTLVFAALTVVFGLAVGCTLAVVLNWEALRFRTLYSTLLFLPYAVPGFISILVFKGLFNQNFGEINAILNAVFGVKPAWFADPFLAKVMILIVNTWLGYPYIMVLCTGLIKAIPADLYEASAIAGAKPLTNFFRITAPLIVKPLYPLLISAFAFNFNNFVLIALLTNGRPDYLNTKVPAGTTDILVSYTHRIAFQDSGQNFGVAAAISTVIFVMVAVLAIVNLRLSNAAGEKK